METIEKMKEMVDIQAILDQIALNTDILMEIDATNINIESKELQQYLKYESGRPFSTIKDSSVEKKIAFAYLAQLSQLNPNATSDAKKDLCEAIINTMRKCRLQYWYSEGEIDEEKYNKWCTILNRAEFISKLKYRARTTADLSVIGVIVGLKISAGMRVLPLKAKAAICAVSAAVGALIGLLLPKKPLENIRKEAKEHLLPQLKDQLTTKLKNIAKYASNIQVDDIRNVAERYIPSLSSTTDDDEEVVVNEQRENA